MPPECGAANPKWFCAVCRSRGYSERCSCKAQDRRWIRFNRFGIGAKWVVDCKFWRRPVTKENVLALTSVVDDVGADRGILVSQKGFQARAVRAAEHTNVTLTSLEELKHHNLSVQPQGTFANPPDRRPLGRGPRRSGMPGFSRNETSTPSWTGFVLKQKLENETPAYQECLMTLGRTRGESPAGEGPA